MLIIILCIVTIAFLLYEKNFFKPGEDTKYKKTFIVFTIIGGIIISLVAGSLLGTGVSFAVTKIFASPDICIIRECPLKPIPQVVGGEIREYYLIFIKQDGNTTAYFNEYGSIETPTGKYSFKKINAKSAPRYKVYGSYFPNSWAKWFIINLPVVTSTAIEMSEEKTLRINL